MNWQALIVMGCALVTYFIGLGIFTLIKRYRAKKQFEKEEHERQQQSEVLKDEPKEE